VFIAGRPALFGTLAANCALQDGLISRLNERHRAVKVVHAHYDDPLFELTPSMRLWDVLGYAFWITEATVRNVEHNRRPLDLNFQENLAAKPVIRDPLPAGAPLFVSQLLVQSEESLTQIAQNLLEQRTGI
jgi:hypothetical protein